MGQNWGDGDSPMQGMEDTNKLHGGDVGKKVEFIYKVFSVQCGVMWREGRGTLMWGLGTTAIHPSSTGDHTSLFIHLTTPPPCKATFKLFFSTSQAHWAECS